MSRTKSTVFMAANDKPAAEKTDPQPSSPARALMSPERLGAELRQLDIAHIVLVLLFSVFLASFAARNSDYWRHLAAGRLIANGQFTFGSEPFSFNAQTWINHSWLADLGVYQLTKALGGPDSETSAMVLIGLKALVFVVLACLLIAMRRPGSMSWVSSLITMTALLGLSPWMQLRPQVLSVLFLAATLYCLIQPGVTHRTRLIFLPVLFAIWVNVNSWFLLGPLTVGLYLVGLALQKAMAPVKSGPDSLPPGALRDLATVLVVGLLACLANPYHVRAFQMPHELALTFHMDSELRGDAVLARFSSSAWAGSYMNSPTEGKNSPGLCFYFLSFLTATSFYVARAQWRWWRLIVWLPFLILSAFTAASAPFLLVVSVPIVVMNLQDAATARFGTELKTEGFLPRGLIAGRILSLLACMGLTALAYPGFLHPGSLDPHQTRRVCWKIEPDPSWSKAARRVQDLRSSDALPSESKGIAQLPEVGDYLAWYAPLEKSFIDSRLGMFSVDVLRQFFKFRQSFEVSRDAGKGDEPQVRVKFKEVADFLKESRLDYMTLTDQPAEALATAATFWRRVEYLFFYMDGRTTMFGWKRSAHPVHGKHLLELDALAFGPDASKAPAHGAPPPVEPDLWLTILNGPIPDPLDLHESRMYKRYYDSKLDQKAAEFQATVEPVMVLTAALACLHPQLQGGGIPYSIPNKFLWRMFNVPYPTVMEALPLPVLTVRSARRAVAESPNNAETYLALAAAYELVTRNEYGWQTLQELRMFQVVIAFRNALFLNPMSLPTYESLVPFYGSRQVNCPDVGLEYFKRFLFAVKTRGAHPSVPADQFEQFLKTLDQQVQANEEQLKQRRSQYDAKAPGKKAIERARLARSLGLSRLAVQILSEVETSQLDEEQATLKLHLLLLQGEIGEARELIQYVKSPFLAFILEAATGNYEAADQWLEEIIRTYQGQYVAVLADMTSNLILHGRHGIDTSALLGQSFFAMRETANFSALRGILALEAGDTSRAKTYFTQAMTVGISAPDFAAALSPLSASHPLEAATLLHANQFLLLRGLMDFQMLQTAQNYLFLLRSNEARGRAE